MIKRVLCLILGSVVATGLLNGCTTTGADFAAGDIVKNARPHSTTDVSTNDIPTSAHIHDYVISSVVSATCAEPGFSVYSCVCGDSYTSDYIPATEHGLGPWLSVQPASCTHTGTEHRTCVDCDYCEMRPVSALGHSYGEWVVVKQATPLVAGEHYRQCARCGEKDAQEYSIRMAGDNSVYIPGAGINATFTVGSFTQEDTDNNDIVYSENVAFASNPEYGLNNPFIFGHSTGSMKPLYKTKVGQYVYVSVNGVVETYKVVVSERSIVTDNRLDFIGTATGARLWDNYGAKTLHMYTCYGKSNDERWMVLATLVE